MKQMCPAKMEVASLQITCEHFFIHPIIPKMFVYLFLFADYQIRQSQKSSCSCIFNWDGWRHSFWKATNLTTFMTPGTWNMQIMQPVACWCLSNQLFRYQRCTSSAAAWIPRRRPKMCARLRSFAAGNDSEMGSFWYTCSSKTSKKIHHIYIYIYYIYVSSCEVDTLCPQWTRSFCRAQRFGKESKPVATRSMEGPIETTTQLSCVGSFSRTQEFCKDLSEKWVSL